MNRLWRSLYRFGLGGIRRLMFLWVKTRVLTAPGFDPDKIGDAVCFVMVRPGLTDESVLDQHCLDAGRPPPSACLLYTSYSADDLYTVYL